MINKIDYSPAFGRKSSGGKIGAYGEYTGRYRHDEQHKDISRQIEDLPKANDCVTSKELNEALRAQNVAIGKSLIAVLNALNEHPNSLRAEKAYKTIHKSLLND